MKWEKWDRHPQMLSSSCILLLLSLFKLIITQYTGAAQLVDLLQQLSNSDSSPSWVSSHGSVLTISSLLRHSPFLITSAEFPLLADCLKDGLQDERVFSVLMGEFYAFIFTGFWIHPCFCKSVPCSWNFNQGIRKAYSSSNSERSFKNLCICWFLEIHEYLWRSYTLKCLCTIRNWEWFSFWVGVRFWVWVLIGEISTDLTIW